jgi:hypothetical protein
VLGLSAVAEAAEPAGQQATPRVHLDRTVLACAPVAFGAGVFAVRVISALSSARAADPKEVDRSRD